MKFLAVTVLLATLVAANPAPAADPAPAAVAQPEPIQAEAAIAGRAASPDPIPEVDAPLLSRDPKKGKSGGGGGGGNDTGAASGMFTPSRALQLGAVGLGAMELVRLWG